MKFKLVTDLDWQTGESLAYVRLADCIVFGPIDVSHLRGQYFEDNVAAAVWPEFAAALRAALTSTS